MRRRGIRELPIGDCGFLRNPNGAMYGGQLMGLGRKPGLVREGHLAQLLLIGGDPLTGISVLRDRGRITHVTCRAADSASVHSRRSTSVCSRRQRSYGQDRFGGVR